MTAFDRLTDADLMCRLQAGDSGVLEFLYKCHSAVAFALAYRIVGDSAMGEEVVQDAFLTVWRESLRYDPERGSVRSWLLAIVHHRAIDTLRRKLRSERRQGFPEGLHERELEHDFTEREVVRRDVARTTWAELRSLPYEQKQVIGLAFLGELTYSEIAERLELPLGTVKGRMRLGVEKLRQSFDTGAEPEKLAA